MKYIITCPDTARGYITIKLIIEPRDQASLELQLSAWRPGRYEMANYARNIQKFVAKDINGLELKYKKIKRDRWRIEHGNDFPIIVEYNYYARQMDAGGSYIDEDLVYINFINCLLYNEEYLNASCEVSLEIPDNYTIACGKPVKDRSFTTENFYQLADSPLIAAPHIHSESYHAGDTTFTIWLHGKVTPDWEPLLSDFEKFTNKQLELMGDFPEKDYHFLIFILPYPHYHGVEHANSTVITLGPSERFKEKGFYDNLIGISSHELFHAWNICKIRPKELLPYDFSRETYFETGYIAEGFTTYYGDLTLARSGFFSISDYFHELNILLKRHYENFGRFTRSLTESSIDLWVDGYVAGIAHRKVSIYVKGAVMALFIDLWIRRHSQGEHSLDTVLRVLWNNFGRKNHGYTSSDLFGIIAELTNETAWKVYEQYIAGTADEENELNDLLGDIGCEIRKDPSDNLMERELGLRVKISDHKIFTELIVPGSPADRALCPGDEIVRINGEAIGKTELFPQIEHSNEIVLSIRRDHQERDYILQKDGKAYLPTYSIRKKNEAGAKEKTSFKSWSGQEF